MDRLFGNRIILSLRLNLVIIGFNLGQVTFDGLFFFGIKWAHYLQLSVSKMVWGCLGLFHGRAGHMVHHSRNALFDWHLIRRLNFGRHGVVLIVFQIFHFERSVGVFFLQTEIVFHLFFTQDPAPFLLVINHKEQRLNGGPKLDSYSERGRCWLTGSKYSSSEKSGVL